MKRSDTARDVTFHSRIPTCLRCEYQEYPRWIDSHYIRFSWEFPRGCRRGFSQYAYCVIVYTASDRVVWDSGKILGSRPFEVVYQGEPLQSFTAYRWKVCIWDEQDRKTPFSPLAFFETSALSPEAITASWISTPKPKSYHTGIWTRGTAPKRNNTAESIHYHGIYLSTTCSLQHPVSDIVRARAYVTGVGLYRLFINGIPVSDHLLSPAQTDYRKRVLYDVLLLDDVIREKNNVTLLLGNGRHIALYGFEKPRGLVQILIEYQDGECQWIFSDASWKYYLGPVLENSLFDGEVYDSTISSPWETEPQGNAEVVSGYPLQAAGIPPITTDRKIIPEQMWKSSKGFLFDFGQNFSGVVEFSVNQPRGTRLCLRHAENVTKGGELNPSSNRSAAAEDTYICAGGGREVWHPSLTYHGFRYVELSGYQGIPDCSILTGLFLHTRVETSGKFICSNKEFNQVHKAVIWGQLSNLMGIPTDSPQRDERHGWLGDAHLSVEESLLNFYPLCFYEKFLQDIADTQESDGSITDVAPKFWMSKPADPAWGSALITISWSLYWYSGDKNILRRFFHVYESYIGFLTSRAQKGIIEDLGTFGDWCAPGLVASKKTGLPCISTWYYHHDVSLLARIAQAIGEHDKAVYYHTLAKSIRVSFIGRFWREDHIESLPLTPWDFPDQTSQILALSTGLFPTGKQKTLASLLDQLTTEGSGDHVGTGIHGTRYLLEVLSDHGYNEKAYTIASQESYPGWIYMIHHGATTLWERWEYITCNGMNSHNHIMFGSIDSWYYQYVAGITSAEPGWKTIAYYPGMYGQIAYAKAQVHTPYGTAEIGWERTTEGLLVSLEIPPGSAGELYVPEKTCLKNEEIGMCREPCTHPQRVGTADFRYHLVSGSYLVQLIPQERDSIL